MMFEFEKDVVPDSIWKESERLYWIVTRGLGITLLVMGFHYLHPIVVDTVSIIPESSSGQLQSTSIFATVLLTFALVAVYRDISKTQAIQADLQQQQTDFSRALERPRVLVEGYRPSEEEGDHSVRPFELLLSNIGRSPASDIRLEVISGFPKDVPLNSGRTTVPLQRHDEPSDWVRDWGTYLEGDERGVRYSVEPLMVSWRSEGDGDGVIETEDGEKITPAKGFGLVHGEIGDLLDDDKIRIRGTLLYDGPDSTEYSERVFDRIVSLSPYGDLGTALERGDRVQAVRTEYEISTEHEDTIWG